MNLWRWASVWCWLRTRHRNVRWEQYGWPVPVYLRLCNRCEAVVEWKYAAKLPPEAIKSGEETK